MQRDVQNKPSFTTLSLVHSAVRLQQIKCKW